MHTSVDIAVLRQMWAAGASVQAIAARLGVAESTISKWATKYKLPRRWHQNQLDAPAPTPEDDQASLSGLALSPWVEERARECRQRHYAERRAEGVTSTQSKTSKWRRGICSPRGVA